MPAAIFGLNAYELAPAALRSHGGRTCRVALNLKTYDITHAVVRVAPEDRHAFLRGRTEGWASAIRRQFPSIKFTIEPTDRLPTSLVADVPLRLVRRLALCRGLESVYVSRIRGLRRTRTAKPPLPWHCVRARVAIQVEGQKRGMQTIEERFVIVRAVSFDDAIRRLKRHWKEYGTPYMNAEGRLVRWQLEEVVDVFILADDHILDGPVEVFSSLSDRRMKPEYAWNPRTAR